MVSVIEIGARWGVLTYLASAVIVFLIAEPEAKLLYIIFFGYYPILKAAAERQRNRSLEYIIKFLTFNAAVVLDYGVLAGVLGVTIDGFGDFGKYTVVILLAVANFVFILYDRAVSQIARYYMYRLHNTVKRILK